MIVSLLAGKRSGYTRDEIAKKCGFTTGGGLTRMLSALEKSTFVTPYVPFGEDLTKYLSVDGPVLPVLSEAREGEPRCHDVLAGTVELARDAVVVGLCV